MSKFLKLGDAIFRADEVVSVRVLAHHVTRIDVNGHPIGAYTEVQLVIKLGQRHEVEFFFPVAEYVGDRAEASAQARVAILRRQAEALRDRILAEAAADVLDITPEPSP